MLLHILIQIEKLNPSYEVKLLIGGVIASLIIGGIIVILNLCLNWNEPKYVMLEDLNTGEFYISEKRWYGYTCIETFRDKSIAEEICYQYNKIKELTK